MYQYLILHVLILNPAILAHVTYYDSGNTCGFVPVNTGSNIDIQSEDSIVQILVSSSNTFWCIVVTVTYS